MAVLVVYCLKGTHTFSLPLWSSPELISVAVVVDSTSGREIPLPALRWNVVLHDAGTVGILMRL